MTSKTKSNVASATATDEISVGVVEQALQTHGLEPLAQIVEAVDLHFWLMNVDPLELVYASPATRRAWGLDDEQSRFRAPRLHPDDIGAYADLFSAASGEAQRAEYRVIGDDGETNWRDSRVFPIRDATGKVIRIAGVTDDVTARKRAEHELAVYRALERLIATQSAEMVRMVASQMDEAFLAALGELAAVIEADYAGIALVEGPDELLRLRWQWQRPGAAPAFPEQFSVLSSAALRQALAAEETAVHRSVGSFPPELAESEALLRLSGVRHVVHAPLTVNGDWIGILGFATTSGQKIWLPQLPRLTQIAADMFGNVIDRVRKETAMRVHLDQLAHVLRLGTMGQLASGMAHELNQPLAAIMNYVHACERGVAAGRIDSEGILTALRAIGAQAMRAGDVIKALRALVKAESRRAVEDLNTVVREALRLLVPEAGRRGIGVHFEAEIEPALAYVDVIQVQQVILNLVQNSFDAIEHSGVETRAVRVSTRRASSAGVEVSVQDSGPGIPDGEEESVFQDFHTSKPQGLGLGLSISRSLVEAHGGRLWLDRNSKTGACFRFSLPPVSSRALGSSSAG